MSPPRAYKAKTEQSNSCSKGCAKQSVVKPGYRKTARGCWGRDSKWQTSRWPSVTPSFWENESLMWQLRAKCSSHSGATEECASHKFTWSVTMSKQPDWTHVGSRWTFCCCCSYYAVGRLYIIYSWVKPQVKTAWSR